MFSVAVLVTVGSAANTDDGPENIDGCDSGLMKTAVSYTTPAYPMHYLHYSLDDITSVK